MGVESGFVILPTAGRAGMQGKEAFSRSGGEVRNKVHNTKVTIRNSRTIVTDTNDQRVWYTGALLDYDSKPAGLHVSFCSDMNAPHEAHIYGVLEIHRACQHF